MILVHVTGPAVGHHTPACFLSLRSRVAGGGSMTYCLKMYTGMPGPNAIVRDRGMLTLRLPQRTIRARVLVIQRFAADGMHARQTLRGTVVGGGTIRGGGSVVEDTPGHVAASNLRYRIATR
jgi:hypothetical protein